MIKGPLGVTHHAWRGGCRLSLSSLVTVTTELEAIDLKKFKKRAEGSKTVFQIPQYYVEFVLFARSKWSKNEVRNEGHTSKCPASNLSMWQDCCEGATSGRPRC